MCDSHGVWSTPLLKVNGIVYRSHYICDNNRVWSTRLPKVMGTVQMSASMCDIYMVPPTALAVRVFDSFLA